MSRNGIGLHVPEELLDRLAEDVAERVAALVLAKLEPTSGASPYLNIAEAADYLRCDRQRVDDLLSAGRLPRIKDGARTLIRRAELENYLTGERDR